MAFTVELYNPGSPEPVAVMHGCTKVQSSNMFPINTQDHILYGIFLDSEGKQIDYAGLGIIIRDE